jgi:ligand-binding SRPBCC domain-containing protein
MSDRVRYSLPMGFLGNLLGGNLVRSEIERVFQYRREYIIKNLEKDLVPPLSNP